MSDSVQKPVTRASWLNAVGVGGALLIVIAVVDCLHFDHAGDTANQTVRDLGGQAVGLPAWPLVYEHDYQFTRPLTDAELQRLKVLDELAGRRHAVAVFFDCPLPDVQLQAARDTLPNCNVAVVSQP